MIARRRLLLSTWALGASVSLLAPRPAHAAERLSELGGLRFIVPTLPGGTLDLLARTFAQQLAQEHRLVVQVLNVEGAGGEIALRRLLSEAPDGRTWLLAPESLITINPSLYPRADSQALAGLAPVACVATSSFYLLVRNDDPIGSFKELLEVARAAPTPLQYGSGGVGSLHHLSTEILADMAAIKLAHIPYKGNAQAVTALVRGDVRFLMAGTSALGLVDSGRLRMLAVSSGQRLAAFPALPSMGESVPGFEAENWFVFLGRATVPESLVTELRERLRQAGTNTELRDQLRVRAHVTSTHVDGLALATMIERERRHFAARIQELGLARKP